MLYFVGDEINEWPEDYHLRNPKDLVKAEVVYVHQSGKFYSVEFTLVGGRKFRETRYFSEQDREDGIRMGIFTCKDRPKPQKPKHVRDRFMREFIEDMDGLENAISQESVDDVDWSQF